MAAPLAIGAAAVRARRRAARRVCSRCSALLAVAAGAADRRVRRDLRAAAGRRAATGRRRPPAPRSRRLPAALRATPAPRYGIDPWILAGIGWIETQHGRSTAPGVRSGVNAYGCCAGPMQFSVVGTPEHLGPLRRRRQRRRPQLPVRPRRRDPRRRPLPARQRRPRDYRAALFAYNHADWYVAEVLAKAAVYRGAAAARRCRS